MGALFGRLQMGNAAGPAGCEGVGANVFGHRGGCWGEARTAPWPGLDSGQGAALSMSRDGVVNSLWTTSVGTLRP